MGPRYGVGLPSEKDSMNQLAKKFIKKAKELTRSQKRARIIFGVELLANEFSIGSNNREANTIGFLNHLYESSPKILVQQR